MSDRPIHNTDDFLWINLLLSEWQNIAAEAAKVCVDHEAVPTLREISPDHARIAGDGNWRSFFLQGYGYRIESNRARCPATSRLIDAVPGLNSAFFSILVPGAHIPRHCGVTKGLLTCHIGLRVPAAVGQCTMQVANQTVEWAEGRALVFDDTYPHEVWNNTLETRIVLLIQFRRPMRLFAGIVADLFLMAIRRTDFVKDALRGLRTFSDRSESGGISSRLKI